MPPTTLESIEIQLNRIEASLAATNRRLDQLQGTSSTGGRSKDKRLGWGTLNIIENGQSSSQGRVLFGLEEGHLTYQREALLFSSSRTLPFSREAFIALSDLTGASIGLGHERKDLQIELISRNRVVCVVPDNSDEADSWKSKIEERVSASNGVSSPLRLFASLRICIHRVIGLSTRFCSKKLFVQIKLGPLERRTSAGKPEVFDGFESNSESTDARLFVQQTCSLPVTRDVERRDTTVFVRLYESRSLREDCLLAEGKPRSVSSSPLVIYQHLLTATLLGHCHRRGPVPPIFRTCRCFFGSSCTKKSSRQQWW